MSTHDSPAHVLVVCGATRLKDHWIFKDFMGICRYLKSHGIHGRFVNCFPVQEYFDSGDRDTLKFCERTHTGRALYYFSRFEALHREPFYEYHSPDTILSVVQDWIQTAVETVRGESTVTIIFVCHGIRPSGALKLGNHSLTIPVLGGLIDTFPPPVQVNILSGACHPEELLLRIGQYHFPFRHVEVSASPGESTYPAFLVEANGFAVSVVSFFESVVCSLAGHELPVQDFGVQNPTLSEHEEQVAAVHDSSDLSVPTRFHGYSTPRFWSSANVAPEDSANFLLFRITASSFDNPDRTTAARARFDADTRLAGQ